MLDPRKVKYVVIHCSATKVNQELDMSDIERMHKARGWTEEGYHFGVKQNGIIQVGRSLEKIGAHAYGHNSESVGIVYYGGLDENGIPTDTRSAFQKNSLVDITRVLKLIFPNSEVVGHRDLSPDKNKDGIISPNEWTKQCPCFDVKSEFN